MSTVDGVGDPGGMESSDVVPPIFFSDIDIDAVSRANLAYLPPPHRHWIQPTRCVAMDCDGPKHALIHDLDGSLMGLGRDGSLHQTCRCGRQRRRRRRRLLLLVMHVLVQQGRRRRRRRWRGRRGVGPEEQHAAPCDVLRGALLEEAGVEDVDEEGVRLELAPGIHTVADWIHTVAGWIRGVLPPKHRVAASSTRGSVLERAPFDDHEPSGRREDGA